MMAVTTEEAGAARPTRKPARLRRRHVLIDAAERGALPALTVAIFVFFSVYSKTAGSFLTTANLQTILGNQSVVAITALAAMAPLIAGEFDISVGPVAGMSAVIAASAMSHGWPLLGAIAIALLASVVVGAVNGLFVAYLGVNSFITTLAAGTLVGGLVSLYTHDSTIIDGISTSLTSFGNDNLLGVPWVAWVVLAIAVTLAFTIGWTVYGRQLTSVGASQAAARLVGIRVRRIVASSFVVSAILAGAAGVVLLARTGSGSPQIGQGYTLSALSAAFLGATAFRPGRFNVPGTLLGVIFVSISVNGLTLAGASDWVEPVFTGAALMLAVALSTTLGRLRAVGAAKHSQQEETHDD
jgi:ribose transport system permease protein